MLCHGVNLLAQAGQDMHDLLFSSAALQPEDQAMVISYQALRVEGSAPLATRLACSGVVYRDLLAFHCLACPAVRVAVINTLWYTLALQWPAAQLAQTGDLAVRTALVLQHALFAVPTYIADFVNVGLASFSFVLRSSCSCL